MKSQEVGIVVHVIDKNRANVWSMTSKEIIGAFVTPAHRKLGDWVVKVDSGHFQETKAVYPTWVETNKMTEIEIPTQQPSFVNVEVYAAKPPRAFLKLPKYSHLYRFYDNMCVIPDFGVVFTQTPMEFGKLYTVTIRCFSRDFHEEVEELLNTLKRMKTSWAVVSDLTVTRNKKVILDISTILNQEYNVFFNFSLEEIEVIDTRVNMSAIQTSARMIQRDVPENEAALAAIQADVPIEVKQPMDQSNKRKLESNFIVKFSLNAIIASEKIMSTIANIDPEACSVIKNFEDFIE